MMLYDVVLCCIVLIAAATGSIRHQCITAASAVQASCSHASKVAKPPVCSATF